MAQLPPRATCTKCPTWAEQSASITASLTALSSETTAIYLQRTLLVVQSASTMAQSRAPSSSTTQAFSSQEIQLLVEQWATSQTTIHNTARAMTTSATIPTMMPLKNLDTYTTTAHATPQLSQTPTLVTSPLTTAPRLCSKQPAQTAMSLTKCLPKLAPTHPHLLHEVVLVASLAQSTPMI